jgi:hypothetical protein
MDHPTDPRPIEAETGAIDPRLEAVRPTLAEASARCARRYRVERLAEEIEAESVARALEAIGAGRAPFDDPEPDDEARERLRRYATGLAANVAREALRGSIRGSRPTRDERVLACARLESAERAPGASAELRESIARALSRLGELDEPSRATLVAEESMRNDYGSGQVRRLSQACRVPFEGVMELITRRTSGEVSPEAWRQRVHRSRKRARALLGAGAAATLLLVAGLAPAHAPAPGPCPGAAVAGDGTQNGGNDPAPGAALAGTQNGKKKRDAAPEPLLAGTQNGKKRPPPASDALAGTQNGKKRRSLA